MSRILAGVVVVAFALSLAVGSAAAQSTPTIRTTVTPQHANVALAPGQKSNDPLSVKVEFLNNACTSGVNVTVSLVFGEGFPTWAGASPEPQNLKFDWPGGTKQSVLEIFPSEDAPRGENVTYRIVPQLHSPPAGGCQPGVQIESTAAAVRLTIAKAAPTTGPTSRGSSPGFELGAVLMALAVLAARRPT